MPMKNSGILRLRLVPVEHLAQCCVKARQIGVRLNVQTLKLFKQPSYFIRHEMNDEVM